MFYLLIPFLNLLINSLNKNQHIIFIILMLFIYSILGNIPKIEVNFNYITIFFIIYLIGSFIRIYTCKLFEDKKKISKLLVSCLTVCIISVLFTLCSFGDTNIYTVYFFVYDCNKILAIITSIIIFLWFKNLKLKYNKCINIIASTTFGILCIHDNRFMQKYYKI